MQSTAQSSKLPISMQRIIPLRSDHLRRYWQLWVWGIILAAVNLPLLHHQVRTGLLFLPEAVRDGEWWRVLTFPLVHLSPYHLLLDAGGFLLLYHYLEEKRVSIRLLYVLCAGVGSLTMAWIAEPSVSERGLAGLSGIAHGMMAISALEMLRRPDQRSWGWGFLALVSGKSVYELWMGTVVFGFLHMGQCGYPIAACHAGGLMGGVLIFGIRQVLYQHDV
ncbi:conserved membrane hypothetical protein [Desulfosarcina cetonica]|uniref:rhombosortase n=1 Tax=Desulfosarcina cetonica TaxID=90730 RepID=UPI0009F8DD8A|nr:rhombosortase [Desulfosarcina cetonica]VTR71145.1 conserved membrane hypothetical protein [Desulfosarcina cetonica]